MKSLRLFGAALAALSSAAIALAGDPTGLWKWSYPSKEGPPVVYVLRLELKDGQLTGGFVVKDGEVPVKDATFNNERVTFFIPNQRGQAEVVTKYSGKLEGEKLNGYMERPGRDGKPTKYEWIATRQPAPAKTP